MSSWPILSITTFLPILGVLFIFCLSGDDEVVRRNARWRRRTTVPLAPSRIVG